jgi:PAS domain S-box-containing protein
VSFRLRGLLLVGLVLLPVLAVYFEVAPVRWGWPSDGEGTAGLLGLGLIVGLALMVGWVATDLFFRRDAQRLLQALRERAAGRTPAARGLPVAGGELGQIARAVDELDQSARSLRGAVEQAESDRRAAEARVVGVLAAVSDAVVGVGPAQQITLFNTAAERLFGHGAREAMGQPLDLILPVIGAGSRRPSLRELSASAERWETLGRRKDGRQVPVQVSVVLRAHSGPASFVVLVREASGETALRESEARFRGAFEHSASGMAIQRADGTFVRVNRALCEMLGYLEQELLGLSHQALRHPEDPEQEGWYERDLVAGSIRWYQREQRYRHKLGHDVWGLLSVSLAGGGEGGAPDFLVQIHDITERKRAEALEAQLRQAQKIEAVGQLAAGVAHDFNNLLMVISGRSHILLHRLGADHPQRRHVELIQSTAERAGSLTQQLLAFSRRQVLQPKVIDLNAVVTGLVPMLRRLIGEQIELVMLAAPTVGRTKADPGQIEQVALNLVVNARDAMPVGGRLTIETADVVLDEALARDHPGMRPGPHVALAVQDTGVGMDAGTQARVFEPFFTTKGPGKGTGLGLSVVYGIVKQSGGYIAVESAPGLGTRFTIYLPRVEEVPEVPVPEVAVADLPRGSETILLVEDEDAVRDLIREVLQQAGYTVLSARHGGEALVLVDQHPERIHLLLTDVVMPGLGGRQLADRLVAVRPAIKVMFISGYTDEAVERHGVLKPGAVFLRKPLTPDALLRTIREVLNTP